MKMERFAALAEFIEDFRERTDDLVYLSVQFSGKRNNEKEIYTNVYYRIIITSLSCESTTSHRKWRKKFCFSFWRNAYFICAV